MSGLLNKLEKQVEKKVSQRIQPVLLELAKLETLIKELNTSVKKLDKSINKLIKVMENSK